MTANHPLWLVNKGWISVTEAGELHGEVRREEDDLKFARRNDGVCAIVEAYPVFQAPGEPNVGLITTRYKLALDEGSCCSVVFDGAIDRFKLNVDLRYNGGTVREVEHFETVEDYYNNEPDPNDYRPFRTTVFNIEVEDFHTYFVGELGLWVHNT